MSQQDEESQLEEAYRNKDPKQIVEAERKLVPSKPGQPARHRCICPLCHKDYTGAKV